jgi:hypothetical protein
MDFQTSFGEIMDSCQRNVAAHRAAIGSLRQLKLRTLLFVSATCCLRQPGAVSRGSALAF